jgi:hypothetical protein
MGLVALLVVGGAAEVLPVSAVLMEVSAMSA